ncbi:MAG TPA: hypothetical protein VFQ57_04025 [Sphingomonas sp.]|nr:hypothetical protein [Sphingomonas sp.]
MTKTITGRPALLDPDNFMDGLMPDGVRSRQTSRSWPMTAAAIRPLASAHFDSRGWAGIGDVNRNMADRNEAVARTDLLTTGARACDTLRRSMADKPADTMIETNAQSLTALADVIGSLVDEAGRCGGVDCMGRSIDGTRLWVTLDRFDAVERQAKRYEEALRVIASACSATTNELDMLIDWQGTARSLSATARAALD